MARPKQFDPDAALDAAVTVFREHGYAGTSAEMLSAAMQIGKQSLYNTFGDKWRLYCAALERYSAAETEAHFEALRSGKCAREGLEAMMDRVATAGPDHCLGVGSVSEFGAVGEEGRALAEIRLAAARRLTAAISSAVKVATDEGDVAADVDPADAANFLIGNITAMRMAARGGAHRRQLRAMAQFALRALR